MIIMALDHVRDIMHTSSVTQSPTNLLTTSPLLFFTRVVTYLCAPTFVFLAGTSAYLSFKRKNNIHESRMFLIKRGLWLILLEFTIVNFGIFFDFGFHNFIFEVIATIGFGFLVLGLMLKLSTKTIGIIGLLIIFFHNLFPLIPFAKESSLKVIFSLLFSPGFFPLFSKVNFIMGYAPIPWLGIMLTGFAAGKLFMLSEDKNQKIFLKIGLSALLLFIVLRFINVYGDGSRWSSQKNGLYTFLSFINVSKYPPSLLFCLGTLGIAFLMFAITKYANNGIIDTVSAYGKVPMFYFLVHFYLIHILMILLMFLQGFHWSDLDFASGTFGRPKGVHSGLRLWAIYLIWICVVAVLYKPCVWFGKYKATHKQWWLKYF